MELDMIQVLCWDRMDPVPMAFIARSYHVLHFDRLVGARSTRKGAILVVRSEPTWCWPPGLRGPEQPEPCWRLQAGSRSLPCLENGLGDVHWEDLSSLLGFPALVSVIGADQSGEFLRRWSRFLVVKIRPLRLHTQSFTHFYSELANFQQFENPAKEDAFAADTAKASTDSTMIGWEFPVAPSVGFVGSVAQARLLVRGLDGLAQFHDSSGLGMTTF